MMVSHKPTRIASPGHRYPMFLYRRNASLATTSENYETQKAAMWEACRMSSTRKSYYEKGLALLFAQAEAVMIVVVLRPSVK